ncbi:MAG: hypothetical protein FJ224_11400 [Lentisphaerae bacterium]|nr:hypothetical protein [Lentisphaerota bacterium]
MKRVIAGILVATLFLTAMPVSTMAKSSREPGGAAAFFIGCCWGLREGLEWNEGADMHWREWVMIVPVVNIVFAIWAGIDCAGGITSRDWANANGANWY